MSKVEDQQDVDGSKIIREVLPVDIGDTNLPWLKWEIGDICMSQTKEEKSRPRSASDMKKYAEIQNNEQLLFESWWERKLISSGGLLLCRNRKSQFHEKQNTISKGSTCLLNSDPLDITSGVKYAEEKC
nr:HXXXD-type acyl-transferase family protein [Tanacetum cinerariifolium]